MQRMILSSSRRAAASAAASTNISTSSRRFLSTAALAEDDFHDSENDGKFSIKGKFREGRASYLDMQSTTPLDPRVLDKMMPYMVSWLDNYYLRRCCGVCF